jgi:uncharacterized protein (TIGR02001 family)
MKRFARTLAATGLLACYSLAVAEVTGNVALTSDYRYRGISQTDRDPALQGGLDFAHESGFYAGVWGSNVQFGADDPAHLELDVYAGLRGELAMGLGWDVGAMRYLYPGAGGLDYNFNELYAGLSYGIFALSYAYSDDFFGGVGAAHYVAGSFGYELAQGFAIGAQVGRQIFRDNDAAGPDYTHYAVSLSTELAGLGLELGYADTDLKRAECGDTRNCDGRVYLAVSKSL